MGETLSAAINASARGLAMLGSIMANKGSCHGHTLMSEETWTEFHSDPLEVVEAPAGLTTFFTKGGVNRYTHTDKFTIKDSPYVIHEKNFSMEMNKQCNNLRDGWFGWMGMGGSVFQWHPELQIGFSYVPTNLLFMDFINYRGSIMQQLVVDAVKKQRGE